MNVSDRIKRIGLTSAYEFLNRDPDQNLPKLLDWLEKMDRDGSLRAPIAAVRRMTSEANDNWHRLFRSLWDDVDDEMRETMFTNFVVNGSLLANRKLGESREKYQCNMPWAILMDPTSECNLHCVGCNHASRDKKYELSFDEMDSIVEQGKALGTFCYLFSGGEPLLRKEDIIALCNKHSDCEFLVFTNGLLLDEELANELLRVKNLLPALSLDGFQEETDAHRGAGTFERVRSAARLLREKRLAFGISCCATADTVRTLGSEPFFDMLTEWGAKFAWFFGYIPQGPEADVRKILTADQREYLLRQLHLFRKSKPIFTIDFWNNGGSVGGCIAGGHRYLHINANGDAEPCAFTHYSDSNIRDKTLTEIYRSPLFMEYYRRQPFSQNMLCSCPLMDDPDCLCRMVRDSGAHSTLLSGPEDVETLADRCRETAQGCQERADALWAELQAEKA